MKCATKSYVLRQQNQPPSRCTCISINEIYSIFKRRLPQWSKNFAFTIGTKSPDILSSAVCHHDPQLPRIWCHALICKYDICRSRRQGKLLTNSTLNDLSVRALVMVDLTYTVCIHNHISLLIPILFYANSDIWHWAGSTLALTVFFIHLTPLPLADISWHFERVDTTSMDYDSTRYLAWKSYFKGNSFRAIANYMYCIIYSCKYCTNRT